MNHFTREDLMEIMDFIAHNSIKDTELPVANSSFDGDEWVAIVQQGANKKLRLADLGTGGDFPWATELLNKQDKFVIFNSQEEYNEQVGLNNIKPDVQYLIKNVAGNGIQKIYFGLLPYMPITAASTLKAIGPWTINALGTENNANIPANGTEVLLILDATRKLTYEWNDGRADTISTEHAVPTWTTSTNWLNISQTNSVWSVTANPVVIAKSSYLSKSYRTGSITCVGKGESTATQNTNPITRTIDVKQDCYWIDVTGTSAFNNVMFSGTTIPIGIDVGNQPLTVQSISFSNTSVASAILTSSGANISISANSSQNNRECTVTINLIDNNGIQYSYVVPQKITQGKNDTSVISTVYSTPVVTLSYPTSKIGYNGTPLNISPSSVKITQTKTETLANGAINTTPLTYNSVAALQNAGGSITFELADANTAVTSFNASTGAFTVNNTNDTVTSIILQVKVSACSVNGVQITSAVTSNNITIAYDNKFLYVGQYTCTNAEFAELDDNILKNNATKQYLAQASAASSSYSGYKQINTALTDTIYYIMVPSTVTLGGALLDTPSIDTPFTSVDIVDPSTWKSQHDAVTISGVSYNVYGYRNPALPGNSMILYAK